MKSAAIILTDNLRASIAAKQDFLLNLTQITNFEKAGVKVVDCYRNGGRLYIAGNGGSAADAQHLAAEFVSKLSRDRMPLPAEALTVDSSILTAVGNDYGFDDLFSRQIIGKVTSRDIFLGITTSGKSTNIVKALKTCRLRQIPSVVFTGNDGGDVCSLADNCVIVPRRTTMVIQEVHIVLAHSLCEYVEQEILCGRR